MAEQPKEQKDWLVEQYREWLSEFFSDQRAVVCLHWDASFSPTHSGIFAIDCQDCDTRLVDSNEFMYWVRRVLKLSGGKARMVVGDTEYRLTGTELIGIRSEPSISFDTEVEVKLVRFNDREDTDG